MTRLLASATFLLAATLPLTAQSGAPDAIYYHGHILTGVGLGQGKLDFVSAIAMRDGLVTATGTDQALLKTKGPKTRLVDLGGSFAMPGINDAHTHLGDAGRIQLSVDLTGSKTLPRDARSHPARRKDRTRRQVASGRRWDHTLWPEKTLPRGRSSTP